MHKVLITREINAAKSSAKYYQQSGLETQIVPLMNIEPIADVIIENQNYDYIIISSFNAAKIIAKYNIFINTPFKVIGRKSAKYLVKRKFIAEEVYQDSQDLSTKLDAFPPNQKFVHFSGDHIAFDIVNALNKLGHNAKRIEIYKSVAVDSFDLKILNNINIITFYSPRTANIFVNFINDCRTDIKQNLRGIKCVVLSSNIADVLKDIKFRKIYVALNPTEESMISLLKNLNQI